MAIDLKTKSGNITLTAPKFTGGGSVDLSNYYTKTQVDELIPDVSGFATTEDVAQAVSDKVTANELSTAIANFITDDELDVVIDNYVTKNDLDEYAKLENIPDVSGYALKTEIPDVSGFQTEAQVIALIEEHGGGTLPASEEGEF